MASISDYLEWRGDLTFDKAPFNEVDNYILSKIGCPDLTGIVQGGAKRISLPDAIGKYFSQAENEGRSLGLLASEEILRTIRMLPGLPRYRELRLSGYRHCTDIGATKQFSALTIHLPNRIHYITFRGTDDSIVGWKENFMMSVMDSVPAQEDALNYLRWAADVYSGGLIVGGHSKGGNLAFFAASRIEHEVQDRIIAVYNNDGPGFNQSFFENDGYKRIVDRMHLIVPDHSLVGTLLTQPCGFEVVRCPNMGIGSHDGFSWEVSRDRFVRSDGLSRFSQAFNEAIENTLAVMSRDETSEFIDQLFDVLCFRGAENLTDLTEQSFFSHLSTINTLWRDPTIRAFIGEVIEGTIRGMRRDSLPSAEGRNGS
ncbi:MAG: DUF2974 domain-containing protein [Oscillospiraceae bacterium]|nr:DUF2974 domain-containing protein [Oscillospiraceae bacterium]